MAGLTELDWPDHGEPDLPPAVAAAELAVRIAALRSAMAGRGLDLLVIYGDREHAANLAWATGYDPRFEEALLILPAEGRPVLAAGNEGLGYAAATPLARDGTLDLALVPALSLLSQPREGERLDRLIARTVPAGARAGTVGWKYWGPEETDDPAAAIEIPALIADLLRARAGRVDNATDLLMHPGHGLRTRVDADGIARLEFANRMAAGAVRRMMAALRPGMTDFAAVAAAGLGGLPLSCHVTFATGGRPGLAGPSGQVLRAGQPASFNIGHWGANICRAGWLAAGPSDAPPGHLADFVLPYVSACAEWLSLMRPGVAGGAVQAAMDRRLAGFGVTLNPGHLIGDDEWIASPIAPGSDLPLASGMAMQLDIIPDHPVHGSTRMEDGYVLADADLRADLAARHPAVAARCRARAAVMARLGLPVPDTLLPLADTCGIVAPFLFAPRRVVSLA